MEVYGFSRVNPMARGNTRDLRVLWALEEVGLPYTVVGLDHPAGDLDRAAFRDLNPFGQLPVLVDDGAVVTESGAIVLYLARKSGRLLPPDPAGEAQVLRWSFAALNSVEVPVVAHWFVGIAGGRGAAPHDALRRWADLRLGQLDGWLADRTWLATDTFTAADLLMAHVLAAGSTDRSLLAARPHLQAWLARCLDRPAWQRARAAYLDRVQPG